MSRTTRSAPGRLRAPAGTRARPPHGSPARAGAARLSAESRARPDAEIELSFDNEPGSSCFDVTCARLAAG